MRWFIPIMLTGGVIGISEPDDGGVNVNDRSQYTLTGNWDIGGGDTIVQDLTNDQGTSWDTGGQQYRLSKNQ
jgi:hypothetical protein